MTVIAQFVSDLQVDTLPKGIATAATQLMSDTIAVGWAGSAASGIDGLRRLSLEQSGRAESTLWGSGEKVPAPEAAFVNASAAAALDYDAVHAGSIMHADAIVLPAVLALAEARNINGKEALAAYIAGIETAHRISMATPRRSGWFHSSAAGIFGVAAGCARLLGFDASRTDHALGIALSMSGGTKQAIIERTLTKRLQTAFAARNGMQAALLAERDITGPVGWLDGQYGWFAQYEAGDVTALVRELGRRFVFADTGIKKYSCCLCSHAALDATFAIMQDELLAPSDIEAAEVTISPYAARIVGAPFEPGNDPQVSAQFSVQYAVACAALLGRFSLADIDPAKARDAAAMARARKVTVKVEESWPGHIVPSAVTLRTKAGGDFTKLVDVLPGSPENPLSRSDLIAKFTDCVSRGVQPIAEIDVPAFAQRINALDALSDIGELWPLRRPLTATSPVGSSRPRL
jgi:2-methylcitrate dehydratase PrpD